MPVFSTNIHFLGLTATAFVFLKKKILGDELSDSHKFSFVASGFFRLCIILYDLFSVSAMLPPIKPSMFSMNDLVSLNNVTISSLCISLVMRFHVHKYY